MGQLNKLLVLIVLVPMSLDTSSHDNRYVNGPGLIPFKAKLQLDNVNTSVVSNWPLWPSISFEHVNTQIHKMRESRITEKIQLLLTSLAACSSAICVSLPGPSTMLPLSEGPQLLL